MFSFFLGLPLQTLLLFLDGGNFVGEEALRREALELSVGCVSARAVLTWFLADDLSRAGSLSEVSNRRNCRFPSRLLHFTQEVLEVGK